MTLGTEAHRERRGTEALRGWMAGTGWTANLGKWAPQGKEVTKASRVTLDEMDCQAYEGSKAPQELSAPPDHQA